GFHGDDRDVSQFWEALMAAHADVIVNGHDHDYERFAPQDPDGTADPAKGIREFVVGTGGAALRDFTSVQPNSEVRDASTHGVIQFGLYPTGYSWRFIGVPGTTFTDSGSGSCH
ncbi:MAG TPA: alkaline phosphatase, partial [Candidatus Dormibacteraeota bacterium]|nr:alkaline phosphatase [Candidatus Dormibacteraeota bacterium]